MREMKDSGIEWIGEIPADWKVIKNKYLLSLLYSGGTPSVSNNDFYCVEGGTPFVSISDMSTVDYVLSTQKRLTDSGLKDKNLKILPIGTILYSIYATVGAVSELKIEAAISQAMLALQVNSKVDKSFYKYNLAAMKDYIFSNANGNTQFNLNAEKVKNFYFVLPNVATQRRIANYLDHKCSQIDAIIARQQEVIEKLKAYKLSVITEAVTKGLNPDVPMKDSGVEWIGEIPEHWEIRRIGSFARVTSSKRIFEESYVDEGVPFYRSKEITDLSKGLHVQTEIFIPEEVFEQVNEASPAPKCGDILLTSIGTIGNTWISDGRKFYYKDGNITQIEANDSFDSAYVEYCFSSNVVLEQYTRLAMGSTLLALTIIKIKKILVAFPPLDEQRKIVQYLKLKCSSIDAAIKNKENLITKLVDYKKSLIYEVVTGKKEV